MAGTASTGRAEKLRAMDRDGSSAGRRIWLGHRLRRWELPTARRITEAIPHGFFQYIGLFPDERRLRVVGRALVKPPAGGIPAIQVRCVYPHIAEWRQRKRTVGQTPPTRKAARARPSLSKPRQSRSEGLQWNRIHSGREHEDGQVGTL